MLPQEKIALLLILSAVLLLYSLEFSVLACAVMRRISRRPVAEVLLSKPAIVLHLLAAFGIDCMLYGHFIEPRWIDVNAMRVHTPKLKDTSLRIVQISDLHCDRKARNEAATVRIVNDLKPDIVVATGDYLNDASGLPRLKETLGGIEAPLGKLAVFGNFEARHWRHLDLLEGTGFRRLDRDTITVTKDSETITLSGLDVQAGSECRDLLGRLTEDRFNVFLFHKPELIEDVDDLNVDLYLCGHTHGGQIALPLYGAVITFSKLGKKYESGLYHSGRTTLYVNRGLGLEPRPAPQMRFLARPEITVFDIVASP